MSQRVREFDWSRHPLGVQENWPQSLKVVVSIMLNSRFAMWLGWGTEYFFFYNDAYAPTLGIKHEWALGARATEVWAEIWHDVGPRAESVIRTGEATWDESLLLFLERRGYPEETYHTFSYSPVPNDAGEIGGMLCVVTEDTERVIGERRLRLLRDLGESLSMTKIEEDIFSVVRECLSEQPKDIPFALVYLFTSDGTSADLACAHGTDAGGALAPNFIAVDHTQGETWPVRRLLEKGGPILVEDLDVRFSAVPTGPWDRQPRKALLVPIAQRGHDEPAGFLVAGLNPYRPFDASYGGFLDLLAGQIASGIASARAYEEERKRAEALAEIDRAKTVFFSNVSHEFRTPLTLLLGPLEEIVGRPLEAISADYGALIAVAHRNGLRLLKLVNSLLDFSQIEAGRTRALFEPTDLSAYTSDLASSFRSAMEKAGLVFIVDCPPLPEPVYVDREMWEKIVLNLLSNAFKFTLRGEIRVTVKAHAASLEMSVRDTGTGIPNDALPHLFERFYRVQGAEGRTHEGSGIGLALVSELVRLHGGVIHADSEVGVGTEFVVSLPFGFAHLPEPQRAISPVSDPHGTPNERSALAFVAEAMRWLPDDHSPHGGTWGETDLIEEQPRPGPRFRILLVDYNADMRAYITRLLQSQFDIIAVGDGETALNAASVHHPDLVLTDVMMPRLDGFALLREMRANSELHSIPVIFLSARAGEDARVEGLEAGADDYLTKPFHARELLAKVNSVLTLAKFRAEALARESELQAERIEILESMNLAFMALDNDFRITYLNAEAGNLYGMTPEKYLGRDHWEAFPESIGTAIETNYRRAMAERVSLRFENFYEPWGQWFELNAYPMTRGRLGVFFRDITERKQLDEQLRRSEALYRGIGESIDYGVWVCSADGRNTYASESFLRLLGVTQEQYSDLGLADRLSPEESEGSIAAWRECALTGGKWDREHRFRGADGKWHSILSRGVPVRDDHGQILCWAGINLDITHLKEAEDALRASEARFRQIADTMPQMVWVTHPDGRHEYFNRRWYEFADLEEGSLGPWPGLFHPEDEARVRAQWRSNLKSGDLYEIEYRLRRKDGEYCWFLCRALPVRDDDGQIVRWFGTCTDIDEFKRVEASLRRTHNRLHTVMSSITDGLAVLDKDWRYTYFSEQAAQIIGMSADQILGRSVWELFPAAEGTKFHEGYHRAVASGQPVEFEEYYPAPINKWLECRCYPSAEGLSVYFHDITSRKQAEDMLRQNEALFSTLIEQAPIGLYVVDAQFRLQQINPIAMPLFASVRPLIGRDFAEVMEILWGPEVGGECARIFRHTLDTGECYISPPFSNQRHDLGEERAYDWETHRVTLPDGQRGVACYFTDVTERRQAEATLREAKAAAETANRSKDRFLAVLSHELRTPLTPVLMAIGALQHDPSLSPATREDLAMMKRNVELETKLIDDLLDLNRIISGKLALNLDSVDLNDAVRYVCAMCRPAVRDRDISLEIQFDSSAGNVVADPARFQQVLWNLLNNAIKFTPAEGTIRVSTRRLESGRSEVWVTDSGIGIPSEQLSLIFDAFEQGSATITQQFGGLGLGLAICKALVELHAGSIRAESEGSGRGAAFIVELPSSAPSIKPMVNPASPMESGIPQTLRLLLVEDHADTARILSRLLHGAGFYVVTASDVAGATAAAEREPFDLLITDLSLPDGTGYDIMRKIREKSYFPGIVMSGFGMSGDIRRSREEGFEEHVVKPIDLSALLAAIDRATASRRQTFFSGR